MNTQIQPHKLPIISSHLLSSTELYILEASLTNGVDPDQTGSTPFVSMLTLGNNVSKYMQQTTFSDAFSLHF